MRSTPCVNFTNILWAAFAPKSFCQKITNPNCKHIKAAQKTFIQKAAHKILVKLTPGLIFRKYFKEFLWLQFGWEARYPNRDGYFLSLFNEVNVTLIQEWSCDGCMHRDRTRVQKPTKIFPHLKVKC